MHVVNEIWLARDMEHKGTNLAFIYLDKSIQFGSHRLLMDSIFIMIMLL